MQQLAGLARLTYLRSIDCGGTTHTSDSALALRNWVIEDCGWWGECEEEKICPLMLASLVSGPRKRLELNYFLGTKIAERRELDQYRGNYGRKK